MGNSPESVVRNFLAAFTNRNVDELVGFFSDDAVFIAGPRGVHRGKGAIRSEFEAELAMAFENQDRRELANSQRRNRDDGGG